MRNGSDLPIFLHEEVVRMSNWNYDMACSLHGFEDYMVYIYSGASDRSEPVKELWSCGPDVKTRGLH